jgi:serine/threonine protein kinase/formylglycine-generating enzyme required for sulfatase activity
MIGKTILHYNILEKLGQGGMGVVYLAEDTKLDRKVAIKFLPKHIAGSADERKRFEIEAKAAAALNHPNIATIHAIEHVDDEMFIVMEYIEGMELKEKLKAGLLDVDDALKLAQQIARGLEAAHEKNIIHRDVKSTNIMITDKGQVKIMDFGLAKVRGGIELTKEQSTIGTAAYMSPEQARGDKVDQRSDLWSFAIVVYEMLTGKLPFRGDYDQAVIYSILNEDPQPPNMINPQIPDVLNDVVLQTLAKDPHARPSSATEMLQKFESVGSTLNGTKISVLQILRKPQILAVLILALMIPTILYLFSIYSGQSEQGRAAQLSAIKKAAAAGDYFKAFELSREAESDLAADSVFQALQPVISNKLTILSMPAGATVSLKLFAQADQSYQTIGVTPIQNLLLARDDYIIRVEKEGFIPVECLASNEWNRRWSRTGPQPDEVLLSIDLSPAGTIPENMVPVSGGPYRLVGAGAPTAQTVELDSFFIDKYEVTNQEFKKFILAGGYNNQSYWLYPFIKEGKKISRAAAMPVFTDRSGLPGPRNWVNQEYPTGEDSYPVSGITWYEAAAYSEYVGKRLPTVFEWEKAARDGIATGLSTVLPWGLVQPGQSFDRRANLNGRGTVPVGEYEFGISPYGCFNMSGNVKEWCSNQITGGYITTGGSFQDPVYMFAQFGAFDGFYSSPTLGFRCARSSSDSGGSHGNFRIDVNKETPEYEAVDAKAFKSLLSHYNYDKKPVETKVIETVETEDWIREKRIFVGPGGEDVILYLYLPHRAARPYQCLFYVPGLGMFMGRSVPQGLEQTIGPQIKSGRAACTVVLKGATEREWEPDRIRPATSSVQFREEMVLHATEIRMGIDYLESREDIDMKKFAYVGRSWGAGSRLGFAAIDNRFRAVVFLGGGIDERVKPTLPEADNINFAPYISQPKLMVNGKHDEEHNWYTRGLPLFNLLSEPKELALLDGGHMPPVELRTPVINNWLDKILGPVRFN